MAAIVDELSFLPFFRRISAEDIKACAHLWEQVSLRAGQIFWVENAVVDELALVISGEFSASVAGIEVGKVLPPEIIGETSAFFNASRRSTTLTALRDTVVLTLSVKALRELRRKKNALYEVLLEQALVTLTRRVRATDQRIAKVAEGGQKAPIRTESSALVRFWKSLRPGGPRTQAPSLIPLLCQQPVLRDADPDTISILSEAFQLEAVEEGQILFLEGEPGSCAYIIAEGSVDVLRNVRGQKAELLATLKAGSQFGINTLIEKGARTASCVAAQPSWLYRIDDTAHRAITGEARLAWRESILVALAGQIHGANSALQRATPKRQVEGPPEEPTDHFKNLLKASGYLEGNINHNELDDIEVVITEDEKRNRRRR